jgi:hypothetical protein
MVMLSQHLHHSTTINALHFVMLKDKRGCERRRYYREDKSRRMTAEAAYAHGKSAAAKTITGTQGKTYVSSDYFFQLLFLYPSLFIFFFV